MKKSTFGERVHIGQVTGGIVNPALGQWIFTTQGWSEITSRLPRMTSKATIRHQHDCHVLGGYFQRFSGPTWDLEKIRADKPNWRWTVPLHTCNW
ncbi:hypothetical protein SAMN05428996_1476 [Quadrisphaera sp. DSM 44207]|nr:hypothetical protein SAMN05428996_1476 [Quadrisphaera sp. DSM 44207]